jgi:hypothetical protein
VKLSFKEGQNNTMSMVVKVGEEEGESRNCLGEPRTRGETNSTIGYVISFVLFWYYFRICSHVIMFYFKRGGPFSTGKGH